MTHYTCDLCKQPIDPQKDVRYVVNLEVYPALEPNDVEPVDDRDHLEELHDLLESLADDQDVQPQQLQVRYDLCPECRKRFVKNPLGHENPLQFEFSKN